VANTRASALQSQLRSTRTKLAARLDELEVLKLQIGELERTNRILEASANDHAIKYRIVQEEKQEIEQHLEHRGKRNQELMGKYLRLEEDYAVLQQRSSSNSVSTP